MLDTCPKCDYALPVPAESCPRCGVIFAKVQQVAARPGAVTVRPDAHSLSGVLLAVREEESAALVVVRALFMLFLSVYGIRLIFTPILAFPETSVLLHSLNLVFHEAGHVLFMPFGRFMQVFGGSLMQWIVPAVVAVSFLWKRDAYGAAVGVWWLGESFLDISPYINDARAGQLMLLGGVTGSEVEDYHDWEILLTRLGMMQYDHALARMAFMLGSLLMLAAMLWGSYLVLKGWQLRSRS